MKPNDHLIGPHITVVVTSVTIKPRRRCQRKPPSRVQCWLCYTWFRKCFHLWTFAPFYIHTISILWMKKKMNCWLGMNIFAQNTNITFLKCCFIFRIRLISFELSLYKRKESWWLCGIDVTDVSVTEILSLLCRGWSQNLLLFLLERNEDKTFITEEWACSFPSFGCHVTDGVMSFDPTVFAFSSSLFITRLAFKGPNCVSWLYCHRFKSTKIAPSLLRVGWDQPKRKLCEMPR